MKGLKITNIILFILNCISQVIASIFFIQAIVSITSTKVGGALAILALLPLYLIMLAIIIVFTIILASTKKALNKKLLSINQSPDKLSKIFALISYCFIALNIISFVIFILVN